MQKQKGFTLIELMIVVAVIGVLSAIAIPQYQNYVKKGALGAALASASALKTNVEDEIATKGAFPASSSAAFNIGSITLTRDSGASAAGSIVAAITDGAGAGANITLTRTEKGVWNCTNSNSEIDITGC